MSSLQGKVAIVTGGSRGIGKAICHRLARDGASVVVNYASNTAQAEETVKQIGTERALAVKADASKVSEIQELVDATMKKFGRIDLVIAAAGIMPLCELDKLTEEEFDSLFNLNVKGPMFLVQKAAPHMKSGGRIMLFSTNQTIATNVTPNYLTYCATKGAINQMTRLLSKDLARKGIMVNAVAPGPTATDMFLNGKSEQLLNTIKSYNPQNKIGEPEQVADVVAFLCSDASSWVCGQTLYVNGGTA